jgi:high-affinity iron transporter
VLANFLIGLREGLEASLVVGILAAYLLRTGRRDRLSAVWLGIGAAAGLSLAIGAVLTFTSAELDDEAGEAFGGIMSLVAVGFVTWMIFWMRRAARSMRAELHGRVDKAVAMGTGALVTTAFVAVAREGIETALFVWSAVRAAGAGAQPLVGAVLGIAVAVALGWLLYRRAVAINLARFFTWTGAALVAVAAGVLAYGVHELQEAGVLPGEGDLAFDVSGVISPSSVAGTLVRGVLNLRPQMAWLEVGAWLAYLVPVMYLFFRGSRRTPAPAEVLAARAGQGAPSRS